MTGTLAQFTPFVEWDVRNWSAAPQFWMANTELDLRGTKALEIGSRHGGLSLWLAQQGAEVTCSDLEGPTARARAAHLAGGVAAHVRYAKLDALDLPFDGEFDLVMFKSVLGSLRASDQADAQRTAILGMHRALRPGGELFFAENLVGSGLHRLLRRHFVPWADHWRYIAVEEMGEWLSPFSSVTYRTVGFSAALGRTERQRALLGTLDRALLDRLVPESWRYVMIGVARK